MDFKRTLLAAAVFTLSSAAHALEIKFADIHPAGYPPPWSPKKTWARR